MISTQPIGPVVCSVNPVLIKTPYRGPGKQKAWQVEIASSGSGNDVVWRSHPTNHPEQLPVNGESGQYLNAADARGQLGSGRVYYCRVRQQGDNEQWSAWSPWHQPLKTQ